MKKLELGIVSFVELTNDSKTYQERTKEIIEEIKLADDLGLDFFGIGEHHRKDYVASSPITILSAASQVTKNITLGTAVVVLSSESPVRLIEQYRTLHLLSNGRVELMVGRGSFIESFPLFGLDLDDYHLLFEEKLELLTLLNKNKKVTWSGKTVKPLNDVQIYPEIDEPLNISIGVGGSRESIIRAAKYGLPLVLAIIGGNPLNFKPFVELYKYLYVENGHDINKMHITINLNGFITDDKHELGLYKNETIKQMNVIGKERGWSRYDESAYKATISKHGAMVVGNAEEVASRIKYLATELSANRVLMQFTIGTIPTYMSLNAIKKFAQEVKPLL